MAAPALNWPRSLTAVMLVMLLPVGIVYTQEIPPPAYQLAAQRVGIPSAVLYAVALQESGIRRNGRLIPWPWTLNVAGQSLRYVSRADACARLKQALRQESPTRVDVGLGQINVGYHQQHYRQPCDLLDPYANLGLAADLLRKHHAAGEDWLLAMGRYHRPAGGAPAERYRRSVSQHLDRVLGTSRSRKEPTL